MKTKSLLSKNYIFFFKTFIWLLFILIIHSSPSYTQCTDTWLSFDGVNDRVNAGDVDAAENTSTFTLEAKVKFKSFQ